MTTVGDEFTLSVGEDGEEEKTKENGTTCKPDEGDRHSLNGENSPSGEALSRDGRLLVASVFIEDALQHRHIGIPYIRCISSFTMGSLTRPIESVSVPMPIV